MKALLVIDMQEDYVGEKRDLKKFPYESKTLIENINKRILEYNDEKNIVIYIVNSFFYQSKEFEPKLVSSLKTVQNTIFKKRRASCFSSLDFCEYITQNKISKLEIVGVDGLFCVGKSALDAAKKGFFVKLNEKCVGVSDNKKFEKMKNKLIKNGIEIV